MSPLNENLIKDYLFDNAKGRIQEEEGPTTSPSAGSTADEEEAVIEIATTAIGRGWKIEASMKAKRTSNPIRNITDSLRPAAHHGPEKPLLALSLGDPTIHGNLPAPQALLDAIEQNLKAGKHNGYDVSTGSALARRALANAYSVENQALTEEDVILASGGSGALEIVISCLLNEGDALLVPNPGFSLYQVITKSLGAIVQAYDLLPVQNWEIDLPHLESLITEKTKAILVNSPSNPTGTILSKENLLDLLDIAERYKLPVISDEIYGKIVFSGYPVYPLASLTTTVPILTIGGLAKQFSVPGWRVGWIVIYDQQGIFAMNGDNSVRKGLRNLTQIIIGANTLCMSAIPALFPPPDTPEAQSLDTFYHHYIGTLEFNARYITNRINTILGLSTSMPQGAMYAMIKVDSQAFRDIEDDVDFCQKLLYEENLVTLPGQCFGIKDYIRLVVAPPEEMLGQAMDRIEAFCLRHSI